MEGDKSIQVQVASEIGELEVVIVHTPGQEVENMTPRNAERALYSDILNLPIANNEYQQFKGIMQAHSNVFEMRDLLNDILNVDTVRKQLIDDIFFNEHISKKRDYFSSLTANELTRQLIEGVVMKKDNLTNFFDENRYSLDPLHNFFFMRDASMAINNNVLIGKMASSVRDRESRIMEAIFDYHPMFNTKTINPYSLDSKDSKITIEGGDVIVARDDVLIIGTGNRTSSQGIDFILEQFKTKKSNQHIIVQELPHSPESFIHLDMVFTFLDRDKCMVFEPVIMQANRYRTVHIHIDNGKVKINIVPNILVVLKTLGFDLEPVWCGGKTDPWMQEREQWHSGANFLAVGQGKIIGYERNMHTVDEMNKHGFEIFKANDILTKKVDVTQYNKYLITIEGSELARGGGGARCMSMPVRRKSVDW